MHILYINKYEYTYKIYKYIQYNEIFIFKEF